MSINARDVTEHQIRIPRILYILSLVWPLPMIGQGSTDGKIGALCPDMGTSLLLHFPTEGFVVMLVDPAWCKCPRCPPKNYQRLEQGTASDVHPLRTTEKHSHLTGTQGEDRNPRPVHMPRLVPNSPFRRSATRLRPRYRGLSWHPKPAGTRRKKRGCVLGRGVDLAARGGMSC